MNKNQAELGSQSVGKLLLKYSVPAIKEAKAFIAYTKYLVSTL